MLKSFLKCLHLLLCLCTVHGHDLISLWWLSILQPLGSNNVLWLEKRIQKIGMSLSLGWKALLSDCIWILEPTGIQFWKPADSSLKCCLSFSRTRINCLFLTYLLSGKLWSPENEDQRKSCVYKQDKTLTGTIPLGHGWVLLTFRPETTSS